MGYALSVILNIEFIETRVAKFALPQPPSHLYEQGLISA
jgi:hypothetical protein